LKTKIIKIQTNRIKCPVCNTNSVEDGLGFTSRGAICPNKDCKVEFVGTTWKMMEINVKNSGDKNEHDKSY